MLHCGTPYSVTIATVQNSLLWHNWKLSKSHTGTTNGLRHGRQFGVPVRRRPRDSVRGYAWQCGSGEVVCAMSWQTFWGVQNFFQVVKLSDLSSCHDEMLSACTCVTLGVAFREQFVTYAWQMARRDANYAIRYDIQVFNVQSKNWP